MPGVAGRCPDCGRRVEFAADAGLLMSGYVLRQLGGRLRQVAGDHARALADVHDVLAEQGDGQEGQPPGLTGFDLGYGYLQQLSEEVRDAARQRDAARHRIGELEARIAENLADQTSARHDIGTAAHTRHRELASELASLLPEIHALARLEGTRSKEAWCRAAAAIFRVHFASAGVTEAETALWQRLQAASDLRARGLANRAVALAWEIGNAPGCQQWLWDIAPPGTPFDPAFHEPWQNCELDGTVKFVVIPAYLADFTVIAKPQVFTSW